MNIQSFINAAATEAADLSCRRDSRTTLEKAHVATSTYFGFMSWPVRGPNVSMWTRWLGLVHVGRVLALGCAGVVPLLEDLEQIRQAATWDATSTSMPGQ
jgi:hypothetical protein